jgi:hypothetical protein
VDKANSTIRFKKIVPIRVSDEQWVLLKREADRLGMGASTLARIWLNENLGKLKNGTLEMTVKKD